MGNQNNKTLKEWRCPACGSLLAYVENDSIVRIKRKDFYIQIEGGKILTNCYKCAKTNFLVDDNFKTGVVDLKENTEKKEVNTNVI